MPRTSITTQVFSDAGVDSIAAVTLTAADVANMNQTDYSPNTVILAFNTDAANPYDFTVTGLADLDTGRTGNLVQEIAAGACYKFGPVQASGWKQSDGQLYFQGENSAIKFAVLQIRE